MKNFSIGNIIIFVYSIFFNFRFLPVKQAIMLPILISPKIKIDKLNRRNISIVFNPKFGDIQIGINSSRGLITHCGYLSVSKNGKLIFRGRIKLCSGVSIRIDRGYISFGAKTFVNGNSMFRCTNSILLGEKLLVGWNVSFSTDDGHYIIENNKRKEKEESINIGEHVWIASDTKISKGVNIAGNCIIGQNSLVTSKFSESNVLIAGVPAKIVKHNVNWDLK